MTAVYFLMVMLNRIHRRQEAQSRIENRDGGLLVAGCVRLSDRVRVRLGSRRLDRALAVGVPVESTPALALRARRLTALSDRRAKAATYRRVLREAGQDAALSYKRISPSPRVLAAADALSRLADALAAPGPVAARGAAEASLLLTDGTGPLYNPANQASLERYALRALADLALN